jgi:site-specific DNA-methyltransferase (adenine-specific)
MSNGLDKSLRKNISITTSSTESAKQWDGWGTALKPANEPIVLARKPLEKGLSIAENILKWGVGGINIDASRIGTQDKIAPVEGGIKRRNKINQEMGFRKYENGFENQDKEAWEQNSQGRFPANIILTHHEDCECKGSKKVKGSKDGIRKASSEFGQNSGWNDHENKDTIRKGTADENGQEEVEDWDCHEDCPIRILDEQSGITKSSGGNIGVKNNSVYGKFNDSVKGQSGIGDKGGASRFFYVAKASKAERNKGLEDFEEKQYHTRGCHKSSIVERPPDYKVLNHHPTVKPIKLMQYLVKMITPPNGIVLDPFCGSGTTGVACKLDGFQFVGLEQDPEYAKIAEARITNYEPEVLISKKSKEKNNIEQIPLF